MSSHLICKSFTMMTFPLHLPQLKYVSRCLIGWNHSMLCHHGNRTPTNSIYAAWFNTFNNMSWCIFSNTTNILSLQHGQVITCPVKCGMKYLIHSQTSAAAPLKFGMDKYVHPTLYNGCNYLSMLRLLAKGIPEQNSWCLQITFLMHFLERLCLNSG